MIQRLYETVSHLNQITLYSKYTVDKSGSALLTESKNLYNVFTHIEMNSTLFRTRCFSQVSLFQEGGGVNKNNIKWLWKVRTIDWSDDRKKKKIDQERYTRRVAIKQNFAYAREYRENAFFLRQIVRRRWIKKKKSMRSYNIARVYFIHITYVHRVTRL